jgi:dihydrofolate reductase
MPRLRVNAFSLSLDGYGAGPNQNLDDPLGEGGLRLHEWMVPTRTFHKLEGLEGDGQTGVDDDYVARGFEGIGATIMGRNMFGPQRGSWVDDNWTGWWGPNPPYHHPVFVLTHHARGPITMEGGTTFHFVTEGIEEALRRASDAAGELDVRLGGGVATIQSFLRAGLVDELHLAIAPILLSSGERLLDGLESCADRYECTELVSSGVVVTHVVLSRR